MPPIKFSIIKGAGQFPVIEFDLSDEEEPAYYFDCAVTEYQMQFFLDENGVYYEDYKAQASTFEKLVEHLTLWDEIDDTYEVLYREQHLKTESLDKLLNLTLLPEASDQYTLWFRNEFMYMKQWQGLTTLIVSPNYPQKPQLLSL